MLVVICCNIASKIYLGVERVNILLTIQSRLRRAHTAILLSYAFRAVHINNNNSAKVSKLFTKAGKYYVHLEMERTLNEVPEVTK